MANIFIVYSENWETEYKCRSLKEAEAYRYQQYGYAGYIIEYDSQGNEVANHS